MRGYRYTCEKEFYQKAALFFERGNRFVPEYPDRENVPQGQVHHFVDTKYSGSTPYFSYNKGELQYTYLFLFIFSDLQ